MKTEREMFLYELNGHGYEFKNKTWIHGMGDVGGRFDDDQLNMAWEMWTASAQREGYKLVPVEPPEGIDIKICRLVDHRIDVFEADRIYKTMIGVAE